jgi:hypothetical protein
MENNDNDDMIPTLIDETTVSSAKVPVTILTGYLGMFSQYIKIILIFI